MTRARNQPESDPLPANDRVCLGVITGVRGLGGEVRIKSFTDVPEDVAAYGPLSDDAGRRFCIRTTGCGKGSVFARIDGVLDRTGAESLKGLRLYVPRAALPRPEDDEYYHADLIGLRAELAGGCTLGTVLAVHDAGAGASLEIVGPTGSPVMLPFTRRAVPEVDLAGGRLVVDPPDGVLGPAPRNGRSDGDRR